LFWPFTSDGSLYEDEHLRDLPEASPEAPRPPKAQPVQGGSLRTFWRMAYVAVALLIVGGIVRLLMLDGEYTQEQADRNVELQADALAQRLSQTLELYHGMLRGLVADGALAPLLDSGDSGRIAERERILAGIVPGALRVRLLKARYDTTDDADPPLTYASLALLRTAEAATEIPPLEVQQSQASKFYLMGAAAIRGADGRVRGTLHLALSAETLRTAIRFPTGGAVVLQQMVDNHPVALFGADAAASSGKIQPPPHGVRPLKGSQLRLAYWRTAAGNSYLFWPGLWVTLLLLVACGGGIEWQARRMDQALKLDQALLASLIEDALAGRKSATQRLPSQECASTVAFLVERIKGLRDQAPVSKKRDTGHVTTTVSTVDKTVVSSADKAPAAPAEKTTLSPSVEALIRQVKLSTIQKRNEQTVAPRPAPAPITESRVASLPEAIFGAYDVRGIVGETLTSAGMYDLGRAIGSLAHDQGQQKVIVARDARPSGAELGAALISGLIASGRHVVDLGMAPVPILYFATHSLDTNLGVMVGVSRGQINHNGIRVITGSDILGRPALLALRERVLRDHLLEGVGSTRTQDMAPSYIDRIADDVHIARPLKIVVDCGSGCTGTIAPRLFRALGCEVAERFCEPDSSYPGHPPDPSCAENLKFLQSSVLSEQADIGFAFDGDGDRIGVVDSRGHIIWPDRLLMLLSADVLSRHPGGDVIFDVNCSRALASQVLQNGGRPIVWKSGHAAIKAKLRETGALLAGEWSGHIVFQERWYGFDDALYTAARLLEILAVDPRSSAEVFEEFPEYLSTPQFSLEVTELEKHALIERLQQRTDLLNGAKVVTIDGLRAEYDDGWGLVQASSTAAALVFRFEADNERALTRIQESYRALLAAVAPNFRTPF
jgi:phosphomannomutase / phosphoglucomutase